MNQTSIQTTLAPLVAFLAGLLAGKGLFGFDAATWAPILGAVAAFGATVWGAVAARKTALANTVGNMAGTTVVTDAATAAALPDNSSVVSSKTVSIVAK